MTIPTYVDRVMYSDLLEPSLTAILPNNNVKGMPTNCVISRAKSVLTVPMPIVLPYIVAIAMTVLIPSENNQKAINI